MAKTPVEPSAAAAARPTTRPASKAVAKPAAKPAAKSAPAKSIPVVAAAVPILRKKDLVERVQKTTRAKKKDVKDIVEATLAVLGDALSDGHDLNLPPFGRAKVNRQKDTDQGEMIMLRLRRNGPADTEADDGKPAAKASKEALAEAND